MSKRIIKKKQRRDTEAAATLRPTATIAASAPVVPASAAESVSEASVATEVSPVTGQIDFFIQYQNQEYLEQDIIEKIKENCNSAGIEVTAAQKLSVYLKPEDGKAYFTYAGYSSFVEV